jgi:hypothetical protein
LTSKWLSIALKVELSVGLAAAASFIEQMWKATIASIATLP